MKKEWYITEFEQKEYLHNKKLIFKKYPLVEKEHSHCELCWARFSKYKEDLHSGYYEPKSKSWICDNCFMQFKVLFNWDLSKE